MKPWYKENENEDITEKIQTYLKYCEYGTQNSMFSVEASKLHNDLMWSLFLNHEETSERKTFTKILGITSAE